MVNITLMIMFICLRINSFKETIRSPAIKEGVKWVEFELENHRAVRSLNLDQRDNSLITSPDPNIPVWSVSKQPESECLKRSLPPSKD